MTYLTLSDYLRENKNNKKTLNEGQTQLSSWKKYNKGRIGKTVLDYNGKEIPTSVVVDDMTAIYEANNGYVTLERFKSGGYSDRIDIKKSYLKKFI